MKSKSVVLRNIAVALNESIQVKNTIDRLSQNLQRALSPAVTSHYSKKMVNALGEETLILVDDSDVNKPHGQAFEALGQVRDGSSKDHKIEKGYFVTEMVGITARQKQLVSLFSRIHSSREKGFKSTNEVLFQGLRHVIGQTNRRRVSYFIV